MSTVPVTEIVVAETHAPPPASAVPAMATVVSPVLRLEPSGAVFSPPLRVSMKFDPSMGPKPTMLVVCSAALVCEAHPVVVVGDTATAEVSHFSFVFLAAGALPAAQDGGAPADGPVPADGSAVDAGASDAALPGADAAVDAGAPAADAAPPADGGPDATTLADAGAADLRSATDTTVPTDASAPTVTGDAAATPSAGDAGCSCRVGSGSAGSSGALVLLLVAALVLRRRR
jgi:MYXO-CTERM domain-containing protein